MFDESGSGGECGSGNCNSIVPIAGNTLSFPDYWAKNGYPWARSNRATISKTFANAYTSNSNPMNSWLESTCKLPGVIGENCYSSYSDTDKFVVYGATVGMTEDDNAADIRCGNLCAVACPEHLTGKDACTGSEINYPSGLLNAASNYAPVLLNNLLDRWGYMWKYGYFQNPTPPPKGIGTHNIFIYDNVTAYNVSSIIASVAQQEINHYTGNPYNPNRPLPEAKRPFYLFETDHKQYLNYTQHSMSCHGDQIYMITPTNDKSAASLFRLTNVVGTTTNLQLFFNNEWSDVAIEDCNPRLDHEFQYLAIGTPCTGVLFSWSSVPTGFVAQITGSCHHNGPLYRQGVQDITCYGNGYNDQGSLVSFTFEYS